MTGGVVNLGTLVKRTLLLGSITYGARNDTVATVTSTSKLPRRLFFFFLVVLSRGLGLNAEKLAADSSWRWHFPRFGRSAVCLPRFADDLVKR